VTGSLVTTAQGELTVLPGLALEDDSETVQAKEN
jgi:hypothetical protein